MTDLEQIVLAAIQDNTDEESMKCVDIEDLEKITGVSAKILRGVISSLVKKELVEVEEFDSNFRIQYFYWPC